MKNIMFAVLMGILASAAIAHSPLTSMSPADQATVAQQPSNIQLIFRGKIRLTRVTMTHANAQGVDLDLSGHDGFISDYTIPMPAMGSGDYVIEWRGLGDDGHALNGAFGFYVE